MISTNPSQTQPEVDEVVAAPAPAPTTLAPTLAPTLATVEHSTEPAAPATPVKSRRAFVGRRPSVTVVEKTSSTKRAVKTKAPAPVEKAKRGRPAKTKAKAAEQPRKHVGRKPLDPSERLTNMIPVRLNEQDYAKLQLVAKRQALPLAACARMVVGKGLSTFRVRK